MNSYIYSFTGLSTDTKPTDEQVAQYFEDHPEAVIPDGSVTANKLSSTAYATQAEVNSIIAIIEGGD